MKTTTIEAASKPSSGSVRPAAWDPRRPAAWDPRSGAHLHSWTVAAVEDDEFGTVRMVRCTCGVTRYDDRAVAA